MESSVEYVAMVKEFEVYIDRLKDGHTLKVHEDIEPSFLDIKEQELRFPSPVSVCGDIYLAEDHLVLHLKVKTEAHVPCVICNELFAYPIEADFYYTVPPEELIKPIFDYTEALREVILLEIPTFAECHDGKCPEREATSKYLKKEATTAEPHTQFPFSDL